MFLTCLSQSSAAILLSVKLLNCCVVWQLSPEPEVRVRSSILAQVFLIRSMKTHKSCNTAGNNPNISWLNNKKHHIWETMSFRGSSSGVIFSADICEERKCFQPRAGGRGPERSHLTASSRRRWCVAPACTWHWARGGLSLAAGSGTTPPGWAWPWWAAAGRWCPGRRRPTGARRPERDWSWCKGSVPPSSEPLRRTARFSLATHSEHLVLT